MNRLFSKHNACSFLELTPLIYLKGGKSSSFVFGSLMRFFLLHVKMSRRKWLKGKEKKTRENITIKLFIFYNIILLYTTH